MTIDQAMRIALAHHQAGRLAEAEGIYRQVLTQLPGHAGALHGLGAVACQVGQTAAAIDLIGRAIAIDPALAEYHGNLGECYRRSGQWEQAIACFRRAIELEPSRAEAHNNLAVALHQAPGDRLEEAIAACRRAIELNPGLAEAHNNLGNALRDRGRVDEAMIAYQRAIELKPGLAEVYINLGIALTGQRRLTEAAAAYRCAIELNPDQAETHNNLGVVLRELGQLDDALTACRRAIQLRPDYAAAHVNLGNVLKDQRRLDEAIAVYDRAIQLRPDLAEAYLGAGSALKEKGRLDEAIAAYDQAIQLQPQRADAHSNLGDALLEGGRVDEAIAACRRAIERDPALAQAYNNLSNALLHQDQVDEAIASCRRAIELDSKLAAAHSNLGNALQRQGRAVEATASCRRAIELAPALAGAHNNLGNALQDQEKYDEAIAAYHRAIELQPDVGRVHLNLGRALWLQHRLDEASAATRRALALDPGLAEAHVNLGNVFKDQGCVDLALGCFRAALERDPACVLAASSLAYLVHFHPDSDAQAILAENRRWDAHFALPLAKTIEPHSNTRTPDRRLRIGYVSPDLRMHPVGRFMLPLLQSHDHEGQEIRVYSNLRNPDAITHRCRALADVWRDVVDLSDEQLADVIRQDRVDILVDLTMHMANNRLLGFARKPAPVQVTYLAYCGTTGLSAMDYRITDPYLDPKGQGEGIYSEQSVRLPETYWCYQPMEPAPHVTPLPGLHTGQVTFGCLNNFCKVSDPALDAWCRVLRAVPGSRLILHAHAGSHRDRVGAFLSRQGVSPGRLSFVGSVPMAEYLAIHDQIDLALDPFPYGGGTTTCDALWQGVPVVSFAGRTAVGRGGLSILSNVGMPELVADDVDNYVRICVELASDLPRLSALRSTLRERMSASPLIDAPRFARGIEAAYRAMWQAWCNGSS